MNQPAALTRVVKRSAAAALVSITLSPLAASAGAPVFYAPPPPTHHVEAPPFAGTVNYGSTGAFRWGWFGAERFCPPTVYHRGYNGDVWNWSRVGWR